MNERQRLNELREQHRNLVKQAQEANQKSDSAAFAEAMNQVDQLNPEIEMLDRLVREMDRAAAADAPRVGADTHPHDLEDMARILLEGKPVTLDLRGSRAFNDTTLASGTIVKPTGAGVDIRDGFAAQTGSLITQVDAQDLTGLNGISEPYVVSDMAAQAGKVETLAGTVRTPSDPTFAYANINAYETNVTSYVDRGLKKLSPARYLERVRTMALRALRRKVTYLIINGDSETNHVMYGMLNGVNAAGNAIYATKALGAAVGANTLNDLVFSYGGDEEVGGNARLILTKAMLQNIGSIRGTNEKQKLFEVIPDAQNANTGIIKDGGLIVPYTISSYVPDNKLIYGDPINYELGLFGDYTIRVDESYQAAARKDTVLGDVFVGGNIVVHHGFVVGTVTPSN